MLTPATLDLGLGSTGIVGRHFAGVDGAGGCGGSRRWLRPSSTAVVTSAHSVLEKSPLCIGKGAIKCRRLQSVDRFSIAGSSRQSRDRNPHYEVGDAEIPMSIAGRLRVGAPAVDQRRAALDSCGSVNVAGAVLFVIGPALTAPALPKARTVLRAPFDASSSSGCHEDIDPALTAVKAG